MFLSKRLRAAAALALSVATALLTANLTFAQNASAPAPPPILSTNDPQNPLHLTAQQQEKILGIREQFQQSVMSLKNSSISNAQKQAEFLQLQKQATSQIEALLTPSQKATADAMTAKKKKLTAQIDALRSATGVKFNAIKAKLESSLTTSQKSEITQLRTSAQSQFNTINSGSADQQTKQQQVDQLRNTFQQQLAGVLTPAQKSLESQMQEIAVAEHAQEVKIITGR